MADTGRLDELKRKFDENPKRYFAPLANEYRKAGDAELAIELCRTYLPQQPGHMSGYIVYGQALHDAGQTEESAAVFKQALSLDPENIIALRNLGDISRNVGDNVGAMRWYGKVLELDPRNEEISSFLASLAAPGTKAFGPPVTTPERPAPPTIRPEPAPDASAVRLEDIFSEPDMAQTPFSTEDRAEPEPRELQSERSFDDGVDEPFEVTSWPAATDAPVTHPEGESTSVIEGPWHTPAAEADVPDGLQWSDENVEEREPLRFAEFMPDEDAAFAPTPEELGEMEPPHAEQPAHESPAPEPLPEPSHAVDTTPEPGSPAAERPGSNQRAETAAESAQTEDAKAPGSDEHATAQEEPSQPSTDHDSSPFVTETMAELYLSQGLHGEALAIYQQLVIRRDDAVLHRKIAELEAAPPRQATRESVRAFFARIGARRPNEKVEIAAERGSSLAALFGSARPDANDVSAAQRLSGAFGTSQSGVSHS